MRDLIGVDPHKRTHTASALEPGRTGCSPRCRSTPPSPGIGSWLRWAARFEVRRWAVENARGLGRHLAQWLAARGEQVDDVPTTATARVRELSRGGRRKNDVIDAAAAASVAALAGDATPVLVEDSSTVLALLDERRANLAAHRVRLVNQLHALLRDLVPGGADTDLTATAAARTLAAVRPVGPAERPASSSPATWSPRCARSTPGWPRLSAQMSQDARRARQPAARGRRHRPGHRRPSARPHRPSQRFPTARRSPTTPASPRSRWPAPSGPGIGCPAAGTGSSTWRLHIVALTQVRMRGSTGRAYYDRKIAEGKTHNEAMRCLKRRLADHVWRIMIADERRTARAAGPGGHPGATLTSSAAGPTPTTSSSDKSLPGPATPEPTTWIRSRLTNTEEPRLQWRV